MADWISVRDKLPEVTCGHHVVYTPGIFQKQHIVWWNGDLPYNGCPAGRLPAVEVDHALEAARPAAATRTTGR